MDILNFWGIADAHTAVGGTEKIIPAPVGKLDGAVLQKDGGVFRNQDRPVQQPVVTFWFRVRNTGR